MSGDTPLERIEELFHRLVDLGPEEREAVLGEVEATEPEVHRSVARLLARADAGRDLSRLGPLAAGDPLAAATPTAGTILGHYRIVAELGRGGMGAVYEAEQLEPVRRRVAIKVVAAGAAGGRVLERFEAERQTLARMTHPNIAQVYDAGTTPAGLPYVVMELVPGEPLTAHCDRHRLDPTARIRLFLQVCAAVEHAHQKGIVHRDLKPTNVLARVLDGRHQAKVIDFGIAKAIAGAAEADPGVTRVGEVLGTPDYMSPEQRLSAGIDGAGGDVDTRTDVYALGVLLYRLLTGRLPHEGRSAAARRADSPPRPSTRVGSATAADAEIARARGTSAAGLRRRLRGDLDWITLRALEPDRERRYPSVSALADDLERHLRHRPVRAGPPGAGYRLAKLVRRHRAAAAAAAVMVLALIAGTVGATVGLARARRAEEAARVQAATAERVTDFLVDLYQLSDPNEAEGREVTVREVLEQGAERVRSELAEEPAVQARLLRAMGLVYSNLGLYDRARPLLEEAVALHRGPVEEPLELAGALVELGRLLRRLDELAEAEAAYREALGIKEGRLGPDHQELGTILNELALLVRSRDPEEALVHYRRSLEIATAAHGEDHGTVGVLLANIGAIEGRAGRYQAAREAFERALPLAERHLGADDPRTAGIFGNLAFVYRKLGHYRRALEMAERDLEIARRTLGEDHPTLGAIYINLSALSLRLGNGESALDQARRAVAILEARLPPGHRLRLMAGTAASAAHLRLGEYDRAREILGAVLDEVEAGADRELAAVEVRSLVQLAEVERLDGRLERAAERARAALDHPRTRGDSRLESAAYWARAHALLALGRAGEAERSRDRAVAAQEEAPGIPAGDRLYARARWHSAAGRVDRALDLFEQAIAAGFRDAVALHDPAFRAARADPRFPGLVEPPDPAAAR